MAGVVPSGEPRHPLAGAADNAAIRDYWNERVHDTPLSDDPVGTLAFYAALDRYHLRKCDYLLRTVDFGRWSGRDVLEIGCGAGLDLVRFAQAGGEVTGVDFSRAAIELAAGYCRAAGVEARLIEADGARLPLPSESFDLVYCMGVLPFAADPAAIVAEAYRVLRPGGEAVFMVYNRDSWMNLVARITRRQYGHTDAPGFRLYTRQGFEQLLAVFPGRQLQIERFPWSLDGRRGMFAAISRIMALVARMLPEAWWRRYGWHMIIFCGKAA